MVIGRRLSVVGGRVVGYQRNGYQLSVKEGYDLTDPLLTDDRQLITDNY